MLRFLCSELLQTSRLQTGCLQTVITVAYELYQSRVVEGTGWAKPCDIVGKMLHNLFSNDLFQLFHYPKKMGYITVNVAKKTRKLFTKQD